MQARQIEEQDSAMTDYRSRLRELEERTRQEFGGQLEIQLVLEEEAPLPWGLRVYLVALDGRFDVAARFASPWFLEPRDDAMGFLFAVGALAKRQDLGDFVPRQDWDSSYQPPAVAHGSHSGVDVVNRLRPDFGAHSWMPENHAHGERSWSPYKRYSHRLLDVLFDGSYTADSGEQIETMSPEMDPRWTVCIYADPKRPRFRPTFSPDEGELHLAGTVDELTLIRPQGWKSGVSPRDLDAWVRIDVTGTIEDTMDRLLEIILEPFSKTTEVNLPFMENIFQVSEDGLFIFYPLALHPGSESNESIELGVTVQAPFLTTGMPSRDVTSS